MSKNASIKQLQQKNLDILSKRIMQSLDIQTLMSTIKDNINIDDELKKVAKNIVRRLSEKFFKRCKWIFKFRFC